MLRRILLQTRRVPLGLRYYKTEGVDYYFILGVERNAEVSAIKAAFRKKAKTLHPDAVVSSQEGAAQFQELLSAYQVLVDPAARRVYDLQSDESKPEFLRRAAEHSREDGPVEPSHGDLRWEWVRTFNIESDRPAHRHTQLDRMRAELQAEFGEALLHAYHGPAVDFTSRRLPPCFEAEERSDPTHSDLLQIVSGRQLLAVVRERVAPLLADPHSAAPAVTAAAAAMTALPRPLKSTSSHSAQVQPEDPQAPVKDEHGQSSQNAAANSTRDRTSDNVCRSEISSDHHGGEDDVSMRTRNASSRSASSHEKSPPQVLDLVYEDGEIGAVLTRTTLPGGQHQVDVHCGVHHVYQEIGGMFSTHHTLHAASDNHVASGSVGGSRRTHLVMVSDSPFVRHLDFIALRGVGGLKRDRMVCRCKRAWLPPSSTWLFPPRSAAHSTGGWYLELPDRKHSGHPAWVAPEALVLRAALETLLAAPDTAAALQNEQQPESAARTRGTVETTGSTARLWRRLRAVFSS